MCIPFVYILFAELGNNDAIVKLTGHSVRQLSPCRLVFWISIFVVKSIKKLKNRVIKRGSGWIL